MESVKAAFSFKLVTTQLKLYITQFVSCVAWKTYRQFTSTWVHEKLTLKQRIKSLDLKTRSYVKYIVSFFRLLFM